MAGSTCAWTMRTTTGISLDGGIFGRAGAGQPDRPHPIEDYLTPGKVGYAEGRPPAAYDPDEHVKVLDQRGIGHGDPVPDAGTDVGDGVP